MHARSIVIAWVAVVLACQSPDPRVRPLTLVQHDGYGGWISITSAGNRLVAGELIAVDHDTVHVLTLRGGSTLVAVPRASIVRARLWAWSTSSGGVLLWGGLGTASTLSHGYFLLASVPTWLVTTLVSAAVESNAGVFEYPGDDWARLSIWARFPQGLPPGVTERDLVEQARAPSGDPVGPGAAGPQDGAPGGVDPGAGPSRLERPRASLEQGPEPPCGEAAPCQGADSDSGIDRRPAPAGVDAGA